MAVILTFPNIRRQVAEEFRVDPGFRDAAESLVAALAEFRAQQEQQRKTADLFRWYGRKDDPKGAA